MSEERTRRFIIVPDKVIQTQDLSSGAKLLLGFIIRLSNKCGYCWASNKYFAEYFSVNRATVIRWINKLKEHKYIRCSKKRIKRKIYINKELLKNIHYCQVNETISKLKKSIRTMSQYKTWKGKVIRRGEERCRLCGITEDQQIEDDSIHSTGLLVHHVIPIALLINYHHITNREEAKNCKALWDKSNGIILCDNCHRMKHGIEPCGPLDFLIGEDDTSCKNATCENENATGRRNANIDIPMVYKGESALETDSPTDYKVDSIEIKNKKGKIIGGVDTIDYED